ncbi:MAG: type II toxin-antitoxin system RelE/ParE family toxin [Spirochaetaceae bacterium]|nr:MAG: type II toxin-antitoxin system RelE/ParE family toxin [Spirochaetaceae bacterium]
MKILWSKDASDDLIEIISFIAERSGKKMARGIYFRIKEKVESVREFPATGRVVPELTSIGITEIHELIEPPWRIFYRIYQNEVRILAVIDGRRNIEEILYRKVIDGKLT